MNNQPPKTRLNKFLAERLGVSRREADELISAGKITVNGKTAATGAKVDKNDKVCYNEKIVPFEAEYLYLAFHKPVGYVCSRRAQGSVPTIYELLPKKYQHLKTVGRLDKDSSGLILLTNDGDFAYQMTHPKFRKTKVYEVSLNNPLEPLHQQMISDYGVLLDDGPSRFKIVKNEVISSNSRACSPSSSRRRQNEPPVKTGGRVGSRMEGITSYVVFLTEGRNRQIRRTFAALGYTVTRLHRIQFGKCELGSLKPAEYVIIKP